MFYTHAVDRPAPSGFRRCSLYSPAPPCSGNFRAAKPNGRATARVILPPEITVFSEQTEPLPAGTVDKLTEICR